MRTRRNRFLFCMSIVCWLLVIACIALLIINAFYGGKILTTVTYGINSITFTISAIMFNWFSKEY